MIWLMKIKLNRLLACLTMALSFLTGQGIVTFPVVNRFATNRAITDNVLIYCGGENRLQWTKEQFVPYVTHRFLDGHVEWLFQGFTMIEFKINGKVLYSHYKSAQEISQKQDWQKLINKTFEANHALNALDNCIEDQKKILGHPPFRHKVIITLPTPVKEYKNWGNLNGKKLKFRKPDDRFLSLKWYINQVVDKFKRCHFKNIDLEGFYWVDENVVDSKELTLKASRYLHGKKLKFYWIPYFTSPALGIGSDKGFDYIYVQTNYFLRPNMDLNRFEYICNTIKKYGWGLEFEFDNKLFYNPKLYIDRLKAHIDMFERKGIFDQAALSYYDGGGTLWELYTGNCRYNPDRQSVYKIQQLIDRLAGHIVKRYKKRYH